MENNTFSYPQLPKGFCVRNNIGHLGKILFSLTIFLLIISAVCLLSPIFWGLFIMLYFFAVLLATVFSLGLLLVNNWFRSLWDFSTISNSTEIIFKISSAGSYIMLAVAGLSLISAILLLIDNKKSVTRIVFSFIFFVVTLIISLILILGVK